MSAPLISAMVATKRVWRRQRSTVDAASARPLLTHAQSFLDANGAQLADGGKDDPPLARFEEQIQKYK